MYCCFISWLILITTVIKFELHSHHVIVYAKEELSEIEEKVES